MVYEASELLVSQLVKLFFSPSRGLSVAAKKLAPYGRVDYFTRMSGADLAIRLRLSWPWRAMWAPWPNGRIAVNQAPGQAPLPVVAWPWNLLAHFVCAFHFEHEWSHSQALAATARQTAKVTGTNTGVGLYFNYAFTLVWLGTASGGTWPSAVMRRGPPGLEVSPMGSWRSCGLMPPWCLVRRLAKRLAGRHSPAGRLAFIPRWANAPLQT